MTGALTCIHLLEFNFNGFVKVINLLLFSGTIVRRKKLNRRKPHEHFLELKLFQGVCVDVTSYVTLHVKTYYLFISMVIKVNKSLHNILAENFICAILIFYVYASF